MKRRHGTRGIAILTAILMIFAMLPALAFADIDTNPTQVVQNSYLERRLTVLSNGNIYSINTSGYVKGYNASGSTTGYSAQLPSSYCGNLCSYGNSMFTHYSVQDTNTLAITYYICVLNSNSSSTKTLKPGVACNALATDSKGNLYMINGSGKTYVTIYQAKAESVAALAAGETIKWDKTYQVEYDPPNSNGKCYPRALDVDCRGNAYIADQGASEGGTSSVNGIFRYNLNTGNVSTMLFSSNGSRLLQYLYSVTADDWGNVAVVSRNSHEIAIFRYGSTVADTLITGIKGYVEDADLCPNGDIVYQTNYHSTASNNGIFKISMNNVDATGITLSESSKSLAKDGSFTLTAEVTPTDATNRTVVFTSSDPAVATVSQNGKVTAKGAGSAVIKAETFRGDRYAECKVTVTDPNSESGGSSGGATPAAKVDKVKVGAKVTVGAGTLKITSVSGKTLAFVKASNKKSITVPDSVKVNGKVYKVTKVKASAFKGKKIRTVTIGKNVSKIEKNAFKSSPATKLIVKTKKLTKKASVKGSLKGSKVKTVQVKVGKSSLNKKYVKKYKKVFTKKNAGKKVTVK